MTSPTFMLAQFYAGGRVPVLHIDTYRLTGVAEFRDLGLEEHLAESVTLVEWGGLVEGELPEHLAVTLTADPDDEQRRTITITGHGARWSGVPEAIETDAAGRGRLMLTLALETSTATFAAALATEDARRAGQPRAGRGAAGRSGTCPGWSAGCWRTPAGRSPTSPGSPWTSGRAT